MISTDGPDVTTIDATGRPCISSDCTVNTATTSCSAVQIRAVGAVGATPADHLQGFRITGGAGTVRTFTDGTPYVAGGGIFIRSGSPTITQNQIMGNVLSSGGAKLFYGGGIYVQSASAGTVSAPVITTNVIGGNVVDPPDGTYTDPGRAFGGGIYVGYYASPTISGNLIEDNTVGSTLKLNQRASGAGLAVYSTASPAVITQNLIVSNFSSIRGGGLSAGATLDAGGSNEIPSLLTVDSNLIEYNAAGFGGGVAGRSTRGRFRNNTFYCE